MKMTNKRKHSNTVKMMREVRDKIGSEIQNITFSELKKYIENRTKESKLKPIGK